MKALDAAHPRHGSAALPWLTASWVALAAALWVGAGPAPEALVFDRAAIAQGEVWRWITGHLVHSDARHALWDIAALALIGYLLEADGRGRMCVAAAIGLVAVNLCLVVGLPQLDRYCGLSGILNTLFVVALVTLWRRYRHPAVAVAALGLGLKLILEISNAQSLLLEMQWPSVPLTHLAGALGGLVYVALERLWTGRSTTGVDAAQAISGWQGAHN